MKAIDTLRSVIRFGSIETDRIERRLARAASVADLRRIAKLRLPGGVFDYIDGAAEDERNLAFGRSARSMAQPGGDPATRATTSVDQTNRQLRGALTKG